MATSTATATPDNRRTHQRFDLPPAYSPISVRLMDSDIFTLDGHAYDISEGGLCFEVDRAIAPGTQVALRIDMPPLPLTGPQLSVFAIGNVIWLDEDDVPGPARMAVAFSYFPRAGDRERLLSLIRSGQYKRKAA